MDEDKPKFSIHSPGGTMIDWSEETVSLEKGICIVLGHIVWLLKSAEKLMESKKLENKRQAK